MKEYLKEKVDIYIEELVFNLVTKRPEKAMEFSLKWLQEAHKNQRLNLKQEQAEQPGADHVSVCLVGITVNDQQVFNQEYEESKKNLSEAENDPEQNYLQLSHHYEQHALICMKLNKTHEAITYIKKSLYSLLKDQEKANSMEASRINLVLAQLFDQQNQYIEAFRYYKEALWIQEQIFGEDRIESVDILQKIGIILHRNRKYNCALMTFEKSYEIMKSNFSYSCPMVIQPLINLANCLLDLHKFDEALSYYKKVLRMFEKNSSMEATIQNVSFLYNMSIAAENCRFFNESFSIMSEAIDLVLSFLPKNHPSVIKVTERIKYLQHKYGQIGGY